MKRTWAFGCTTLLVAGCASESPKQPGFQATPAAVRVAPPAEPKARSEPRTPTAPIVTPGTAVTARVTLVNPNGFVVLTFPIGMRAAPGKRLSVYRGGLKVGELKLTQWQMDTNAVADIIAGECRAGDEVRAE